MKIICSFSEDANHWSHSRKQIYGTKFEKKNERDSNSFSEGNFEHLITVNRVFLGRYNGLEKLFPSMRVSPSIRLGKAHTLTVLYLFLSVKVYSYTI